MRRAPARPATDAGDNEQGPFTRRHLIVVVACVVALGFDLGEVALSGALSAVFSSGPSPASGGELAWLLAAPYIGGAVGAWPAGRLADRFGRRRVVIGLLGLVGAASIGAGLSPDIRTLTAMRAISGLGLGVLPVILVAYLTDILPREGRGRIIMAASALGFAGAPLLLMLLSAIGPVGPWGVAGWRLVIAFGGLGALACAAVFVALPEAPRWLAAVGRDPEARRVMRQFSESPVVRWPTGPLGRRFRDRTPVAGRPGPRLTLIILLCVLSPVVSMGFPVLSGAVLVERGVTLADSLLYVALSAWGSVIGALAGSAVLERMERPLALVLCGAGMGVGLAAFFLGETPVALVLGGGLFQASVAVYIVALNIYAAELFEVARRAAFTALGWGLQRASAVAAMFLLVPVLRGQGPAMVLTVMAACLAASAAAVFLFGPRSPRAGASVFREIQR